MSPVQNKKKKNAVLQQSKMTTNQSLKLFCFFSSVMKSENERFIDGAPISSSSG